MHTHTLRKILGAHVLLTVFLASLAISVFATIVQPHPAAALHSLSGTASWVAPNVLSYDDGNDHHILFYEQGNDAQGSNDTTFYSETIAQYLTHNTDSEICDSGDTRSGDGTFTTIGAGDAALKSDHNVASIGHVSGITTDNPQFYIDESAGYVQPIFGCGKDNGGKETLANKRPDGTVPQTTVGTVKWTSPYTLQVISAAITPQTAPNPVDTGPGIGATTAIGSGNITDSWLEQSINVGREFYQSTNDSGSSMTFDSVPPLPANPPDLCSSYSTHITIPYLNYLSSYPYAQLYIPSVRTANGTTCDSNPLAGWVKVQNARPTPPATNDSVSASWADTDQLQITGTLTIGSGTNQFDAVTDGTIFKQSSLNGSDMVLSASAICGSHDNTLEVHPYTLAPYATLTVYGYGPDGHSCGQIETITIKITTAYPNSSVDNTDGNNPGGGTTGTPSVPCPVNDALLGWVLCPIFDLSQTTVQALNGYIQGVLFINTDQLFGPASSFENSYNTFRNAGLSLLVLAGLVMVISQAAGFEIFSAYTIRKALPRIVLAAIGMALAWPILQFVITFSNDLGAWITDIIMIAAPQSTNGDMGNVFGIVFDFLVGGGIALAAGVSIPVIFSLMVSIAISLLAGFVVLVLRQVVVILCVILAPLAIAASVLPGTEKLWKFWRESLLGALLMFPIVMGFLASGAALASISAEAAKSQGNAIPLELMAIIAYFAPYLLISRAMGMASSLLGNVLGMVNGLGKGWQDTLKKGRQAGRIQNREMARAGIRFNNANPLGRAINRPLAGVMTGHRTFFGLNRRRAREQVALNQDVLAQQEMKNNARLNQLALDDDGIAALYLSAGRGPLVGGGIAGRRLRQLHYDAAHVGAAGDGFGADGWRDGWSQERVNTAVAKAKAVGMNGATFAAANQLVAANKARSLGSGQRTLDTIAETMTDAANGNGALFDDYAAAFGFNARKSGRTDLADIITGRDAQTGAFTPTVAGGWRRASMGELAQDTGVAMQTHIDDTLSRLGGRRAGETADLAAARQTDAAVQLLEMQNLLPNVAPDVQDRIVDAFNRIGYAGDVRNRSNVDEFLVSGQANLPGSRRGAGDALLLISNGSVRGYPPAPHGLSSSALRSRARVYDSSFPTQARGASQIQPPPVANL